jgi:hypothetical protein
VSLGFGLRVSAEGQGPLVRVFCGGKGVGGFVTPDVGDSTKDLIKALGSKKKTLVLVADPKEADVQVLVTGREEQGTGQREYTTRSSRSRTTTSSREKTVKVVFANVHVGKVKLDLSGTSGSFWSVAAGDLAGKIDKWIQQNSGQIFARRSQ